MAVTAALAGDLAYGLLDFYVKEKMVLQTAQERPLLNDMLAGAETFPGGYGAGSGVISIGVQGAVMHDTAGFMAGIVDDEVLTFATAANMLRATFAWKIHHAGWVVSWHELMADGVTISQGGKRVKHSRAEVIQLTSVLQNRLDDFGESWSRASEHLFWMDGTQDSEAMDGLTALVTEDGLGTVGGLASTTYTWWKNRTQLGVTPSTTNQTLIKTLTREDVQLKRYGGSPKKRYMGSAFANALEDELRANGQYTQSGYTDRKDIGLGDIVLNGVVYKYCPWLDDHGQSKYCYSLDPKKGPKLRSMDMELNRLVTPERPYDQLVFLQSMITVCAMQIKQRNANGVVSIA